MAKVSTFIWIPQCDWAMAPSLLCKASRAENPGIFLISITHPNTKEMLYSARVEAASFMAALEMAKEIKNEQLRHIRTQFEEIKHIARPPRGKVKLKTR